MEGILDAALQLIKSSAAPFTAKQILKTGSFAKKIKEPELLSLLEGAIAAGELFATQPTSEKEKPLYSVRPLSSLLEPTFLETLQASEIPLTAAQVVKKSSLTWKPAEPIVAATLKQLADEEKVHQFPITKPNQKPEYWHSSPLQFFRDAVSVGLTRLTKPTDAKGIQKVLKLKPAPSLEVVTELLEEKVKQGQLFHFPSPKAAGPVHYWIENQIDWAIGLIIGTLKKKGVLQETALRKLITILPKDDQQHVIDQLLREQRLYRHPKAGAIKKESFALEPPRPEAYFKFLHKDLLATVSVLKASQVSDEAIRRAVVQLMDESGVRFGQTTAKSQGLETERPQQAASGVPSTDASVNDEHVMSMIRRLTEGKGSDALVSIRELRQALNWHDSQFRETVLRLAMRNVLSLHRHDYPASLNDEERQVLLKDSEGIYYVGVALRRQA